MGGIAPYEAQIPHLARSSRGSNWRCFTIFFHVCASSSRYRSPQSTLYVMLRCTMGSYPPPPQMIWKKAEKYKGPLNADRKSTRLNYSHKCASRMPSTDYKKNKQKETK